MNNTINPTSMSFKARISTRIKGKNGVMDKIAKEFAEISKDTSGILQINRKEDHWYSGSRKDRIHIWAFHNGRPSAIIDDLNEILNKDPKKVTKKDIKDSAKRLYTNFKLLGNEGDIKTTLEILKDDLKEHISKINAEKSIIKYANHGQLPDNKRTRFLEADEQKATAQYHKTAKKLIDGLINKIQSAQGKGYNLDEYLKSVSTSLSIY